LFFGLIIGLIDALNYMFKRLLFGSLMTFSFNKKSIWAAQSFSRSDLAVSMDSTMAVLLPIPLIWSSRSIISFSIFSHLVSNLSLMWFNLASNFVNLSSMLSSHFEIYFTVVKTASNLSSNLVACFDIFQILELCKESWLYARFAAIYAELKKTCARWLAQTIMWDSPRLSHIREHFFEIPI